jgi:hypothetical protein
MAGVAIVLPPIHVSAGEPFSIAFELTPLLERWLLLLQNPI